MLAQTNLQLYRQMIEATCEDHELELVRAAYDLASEPLCRMSPTQPKTVYVPFGWYCQRFGFVERTC